jgi:N-acetylglucosamine malate deacetylase 1
VQEGRRILAVYAHPDDAEIWAGGTLLAHRASGDNTAICVLTHADTHRAPEAQRGAEALGARLHHFAFPDRALRADAPTIASVAEALRGERPQIILTHWAEDSHPDHRATWEAVRAAILLAEAERDLEALFWSDTYNGAGETGLFHPNALVDVTAHWEAKLAALAAHVSQRPEQYVAMAGRQCSLHGARSGVAYAEGFLRVPFIGRGRHARPTLWESI